MSEHEHKLNATNKKKNKRLRILKFCIPAIPLDNTHITIITFDTWLTDFLVHLYYYYYFYDTVCDNYDLYFLSRRDFFKYYDTVLICFVEPFLIEDTLKFSFYIFFKLLFESVQDVHAREVRFRK